MKKLSVISAVLLLLILAQVGQAADLQAGWYANVYAVEVYTYGYQGMPQLTTGAYFYSTPPGQYGPFKVWGGNPQVDFERDVSVPSSALNLGADQSLVLPLTIPLSNGTRIAYLSFAWQTDYDGSQMYIDLWRTRASGATEQVWAQRQSGLQFNTTHVAFDATLDGPYYFKVNVVPEPPTVMPILLGIAGLALARRRR